MPIPGFGFPEIFKTRRLQVGSILLVAFCLIGTIGCANKYAQPGDLYPAQTEPPGLTPSALHPEPEMDSAALITRTPAPTPIPTSTTTPVEWEDIGPGVSQSDLPVAIPGTDLKDYAYALRIDPTQADFRVRYDSTEPHSIQEWMSISGASIVINGGFFAGNHAPMGRIIVDGSLYGSPLDYGNDSIGVPGLLAIRGSDVEIYALGRQAYNPRGMRFDQAIESYPLLLLPGGQPTFPVDTGKKARRTVIGIDEDGQVVIVVVNLPLFSLYDLALWLSHSGLKLDSALNLDGGRSTGLGVQLRGRSLLYESVVPLPIVLAITAHGG